MDTPKDLAKDLYIKGYSIDKIATILQKAVKTIKNYKSSDGDWDKLKATHYINSSPDSKESLYQNFTEQMQLSIKQIQDDETLKPAQKAEAIARLADSFAKMSKIAGYEDPKAYSLALIKKTIQIIVNELKEVSTSECIKDLISLLENKEFTDKLGNIDV